MQATNENRGAVGTTTVHVRGREGGGVGIKGAKGREWSGVGIKGGRGREGWALKEGRGEGRRTRE